MKPNEEGSCSFCGKPRRAVRKLIAGPNWAFICDECVFLSYNIISSEEGDSWSREFAKRFESQVSALKSRSEN